jgi:hypothetical protein
VVEWAGVNWNPPKVFRMFFLFIKSLYKSGSTSSSDSLPYARYQTPATLNAGHYRQGTIFVVSVFGWMLMLQASFGEVNKGKCVYVHAVP